MVDLTIAKLSVILAGVIVFIGLISLDIWKALKKGAHWIPGDALVLTALTIQAMNLLKAQGDVFRDASPTSCNSHIFLGFEEQFYCENWENIIWTHISRVMLCVLVAYLLPGMARPFSKESWGKMAALGLSILLHLFSENLSGSRSENPTRSRSGNSSGSRSYYGLWSHFGPIFIVPGVILVISLVWLILLLSCATIAHKSIQDIINQKIPLILAQQSNGADNSWKAVEGQVLKSWIVFRACYPESIIARSVLSSSAGMAVTICIVSSFVYVVVIGARYSHHYKSESLFILITTSPLEVVFILMGWAIICWRWVSSVAYYGTWGTEEESWRNCFQVEDFWTRYIVELQEAESSQIDKTIRKMGIKLVSTGEITKYLPPILLRCLYWLQFLVVFFSKGCWFLSGLMFRNRAMRRLSSLLSCNRLHTAIPEHDKVLENVHFLWETRHSVIVANQKAIMKVKKLLTDGNKDGESCDTLLKLLTERSEGCVGKQCLDPRAAGETGLKFLCKQDLGSKLVVEKHFMYATKKSWKLTAISLVTIIVRLFPRCGKDCLKAYSQAWEVMGVVDEYDQGADSLLSKAADRVFNTLNSENVPTATTTTMREAAAAIAKMTQENKEKAEVIRDGKDSIDWKKAAAGNALYKLCKSIDCTSSDDVSALKEELESALADVIGCCIEKVGVALVENSTKWAQEWDETKLLRALYLAGKSRGLMEKLGCLPNVQIPLPTDEGTTV